MTIKVTNNPNGTFTVKCGTETAIVGTPAKALPGGSAQPGLPPITGVGGVVSANIVDNTSPPFDAQPADSVDRLMAMLRSERTSLTRSGGESPKIVHFKMRGTHTLDVGEISELAESGTPELTVHIHMVREDG